MTTHITTSIDIDAPTELVWAVLTDLEQWSTWSAFNSATGTLKTGSRLRLSMPGFTFRPTIVTIDPAHELAWEGVLLSPRVFRGRHTFTLLEQADGSTRLVNDEAFDGLLTSLTAPLLAHAPAQQNGYDTFNQALRTRTEQLAARGSAVSIHA
jgi:hypothetical protein